MADLNEKRIYHPIDKWEEIPANMWGDVKDKAIMLKRAVEFTGDHELYGLYMQRVVSEWSFSCENALTDSNLNKKAWIGHAASALALGCPEDITRLAWGRLSYEQRVLANREAERAIKQWKDNRRKNSDISENVGKSLL